MVEGSQCVVSWRRFSERLPASGLPSTGESMPPLVRAGVLIVVAGCAIYLWWLVIRD